MPIGSGKLVADVLVRRGTPPAGRNGRNLGRWGGEGASGVAEGSRVTRQRIGHSCRPGKVSSTGESVSHRSGSKAFNLHVAVYFMLARGLGAVGGREALLRRVVEEGPGVGEGNGCGCGPRFETGGFCDASASSSRIRSVCVCL